jgi:DNA polymerase III epsilon subunit-like protein
VELLSTNLLVDYPELEIKSVDGFQGREKEVVILSMVRSNQMQNLGFLTEKRRLNVGVTRARRQLVLVCDSQTVSSHEFIRKFVNYVRKRGKTLSPTKDIDISTLIPPRDLTVLLGKGKIPVLIRQDVKENVQKMNEKNDITINLHDIIGMDCEMVGVGEDGEESKLARVSIVNHTGEVLLDSFVAVAEPVTDYRTEFSGVRQEDLEGAPDFETVRNKVKDLLTGKILVGHGLDHDMDVLSLYLTPDKVRDTSKHREFLSGGRTPKLKSLAAKYLGLTIQEGEHNSVEDARTALNLYLMFRKEWESKLAHSNGKVSSTQMHKKWQTKKRQLDEGFMIKTSNRYAELENAETLPYIEEIQMQSKRQPKRKKRDMEENKEVDGRQTVQKRTTKETKNKTMKRMKKNAKQLDNSMSLLKLPKDHHFLHKEFPSFFWERCICRKRTCSLTIRKAVARVEWAGVWLEHREDRADSPNYDDNLLLESAFNNLSNRQLEKWKQKKSGRKTSHTCDAFRKTSHQH